METAKRYECQIYKKIAIESLQNCWKKEVAMPPQKCLLPCASRSFPLLRSQPQPLSNATERWQSRQRATPQSCWRQKWKGTRQLEPLPQGKGGQPLLGNPSTPSVGGRGKKEEKEEKQAAQQATSVRISCEPSV